MSRRRSALRNRAEYGAYLAARWLAHHAGPRTLARVGALLGDLYRVTGRRRREILEFNLRLAFPELDDAARARLGWEVSRHFGRVTLDALRLQRATPEALLAQVRIAGREHLEAGLGRGRGVFLLSAHIGSWEVAALVAGLLIPAGFAVVNRPLDNPLLEAELERLRGLFGNRALGKANVTRGIVRQLRAGGAVGILIDQRTQEREGVPAPFFGHPAWTHPALARLCVRTGAPVVPIWGLWDGPGRYTVRFDPPLIPQELPPEERDEVRLTARLLGLIEAVIRERPEQWLWYHDRWRQLRLGGREPR
jgi:Lauroyl/myristoyl acyltransferase